MKSIIDLEKIIQEYNQKGYQLRHPSEVKSGKEATVFVVSWDNKEVALKVYVAPQYRDFQATGTYLAGRHFKTPSEKKAVLKKAKFAKRLVQKIWVNREFYLLQNARNAGATVPEVYAFTSNAILMQFIGDGYTPAPRLLDVALTKEQAEKAFSSLLLDVEIFHWLGFVHSDLSAYNVLFWKDMPYVIDLPQAIDIRTNPDRERLLRRDIDNLIHFLESLLELMRTPFMLASIYPWSSFRFCPVDVSASYLSVYLRTKLASSLITRRPTLYDIYSKHRLLCLLQMHYVRAFTIKLGRPRVHKPPFTALIERLGLIFPMHAPDTLSGIQQPNSSYWL